MSRGSKLNYRDRLRYREIGHRTTKKMESPWERERRREKRKKRKEVFCGAGVALIPIALGIFIVVHLGQSLVQNFREDDMRCTSVYGDKWNHTIKDNPDDSENASAWLEYCLNIDTKEEKPVTVKP